MWGQMPVRRGLRKMTAVQISRPFLKGRTRPPSILHGNSILCVVLKHSYLYLLIDMPIECKHVSKSIVNSHHSRIGILRTTITNKQGSKMIFSFESEEFQAEPTPSVVLN